MGKQKAPDLADWHVSFGTTSRVIRAAALHVQGGAFLLIAPFGDVLFAAPADKVKYVKRLEPGEAPEADEAPAWSLGELGIPLHPDPEPEPEPVAVQVDEIPGVGVTPGSEAEAKVDRLGRKHGPGGQVRQGMSEDVLTNRVEITGDPSHGALKIDGHKLPFTAAILRLEAPLTPVLSVALPVIGGVVVTLDAETGFEETTRAALIAAGWTPPPEPGTRDGEPGLPMRDGQPCCTPGPDGSCGCQPEPLP